MPPWAIALQASLSITNSWSLFKLMSIELVLPSNYLILFCLLLLPSIFPSIRVFSNESVLCIRWPKYQSFCFSISPSNECSRLISFRIDWFDLHAVQGALKSTRALHKYGKTPQTTDTKTWMNIKDIINWPKEARLTNYLTFPLVNIFPK